MNSKYEENLRKIAEELAEIQHETIRAIFPMGQSPFLDPWDKLAEREREIKIQMKEQEAALCIEKMAEAYELALDHYSAYYVDEDDRLKQLIELGYKKP